MIRNLNLNFKKHISILIQKYYANLQFYIHADMCLFRKHYCLVELLISSYFIYCDIKYKYKKSQRTHVYDLFIPFYGVMAFWSQISLCWIRFRMDVHYINIMRIQYILAVTFYVQLHQCILKIILSLRTVLHPYYC